MQQATERVAGRELDAEIAEKVMGETVYADHGPSNMHGVTPYSTDIAAAWQVVERLRERDVFLSLATLPSGGWWIEADNGRGRELFEGQFFEIAPLAICLAALVAIGN